jgi:hypothetical protein
MISRFGFPQKVCFANWVVREADEMKIPHRFIGGAKIESDRVVREADG